MINCRGWKEGIPLFLCFEDKREKVGVVTQAKENRLKLFQLEGSSWTSTVGRGKGKLQRDNFHPPSQIGEW